MAFRDKQNTPFNPMLIDRGARAMMTPPKPVKKPPVDTRATGTKIGDATRRGFKRTANIVSTLNEASRFALPTRDNPLADASLRKAGGGLRDFGRALVGADPSAQAGQALAPSARSQLRPAPFQFDGSGKEAAQPAPGQLTASGIHGVPRPQAGAQTQSPGTLPAVAAVRGGGATTPDTRPGVSVPEGGFKNPMVVRSSEALKDKPYSIGAHGEHVYSDGTGGGPARTMSNDQIQGRAPIPSEGGGVTMVPSSAFTRPPSLSDVLGHTPTEAEGVAAQASQLQRPEITGSRPSEAQFAQWRAEDVASGDWRSGAGMQARQVRDQLNSSFNSPEAKEDIRKAQDQVYGAPQQDAQRQAEARLQQWRDQSALQRTQVQGQNQLATGRENNAAALQRTQVQGQNQLDTTRLSGQQSIKRERVSGQNQGASAAQKRTNKTLDNLASASQKQLEVLAKGQPLTPDGGQAPPTPEMIKQARMQAAQINGLNPQVNPETGEIIALVNGQWMAI